MDSVDLQVLKAASAWSAQGRRATLGTITRTWGSAPRPIGAMMLIRDDGVVVGSVSGGCIEDDLINRVQQGKLGLDKPEVTSYGVSAEEARRFGLPCGGTLQLVLEPVADRAWVDELLALLAQGRTAVRALDLASGHTRIAPSDTAQALCDFDGATLTRVFGPRYRLLIIGAGQLSQYLAQVAQGLDYHVTVCDPREEYTIEWNMAGVELTREMPDDAVLAMKLDAHSAVVAVTHDPKLDDLALMEALKSPAFYVGALGSKANNAKRRERLKLFDLTQEQIDRLHGPVGLQIGSRTPPEIAISILAEMTAVKNGVALAERAATPSGAATRLSESACSTAEPRAALSR